MSYEHGVFISSLDYLYLTKERKYAEQSASPKFHCLLGYTENKKKIIYLNYSIISAACSHIGLNLKCALFPEKESNINNTSLLMLPKEESSNVLI
jgi:hypothetical protein